MYVYIYIYIYILVCLLNVLTPVNQLFNGNWWFVLQVRLMYYVHIFSLLAVPSINVILYLM